MSEVTVSSYICYKKDTRVFLTWLGETSQKAGWKPGQEKEHAPRLKGKARKELKKALTTQAADTPSTLEILQQIRHIKQAANTSKGEAMPIYVHNALLRCIKARERFAAWYKETKSEVENRSNETHEHFISLLKRGLSLFQDTNNQSGSKADEKDEDFVANLFGALQLEETPDHDEAEIAKYFQASTGSTSASTTVECGVELKDADIDFAIFSLFEDMHRLRAEAQEVWRRLKSGQLTIAHATLMVAMVIELAKRCERETAEVITSSNFTGDIDKRFPYGTYGAFAAKIYNSKALGRENQRGITDEMTQITPFDQFVFQPLGLTTTDLGYYTMETIRKQGHPWAWSIIPLEPLDTDDPQMHEARREAVFLIETFYEMQCIEWATQRERILKPAAIRSTLPFFDILHNALRPVWTEFKVDMTTAFAARLLVDMHQICGPMESSAIQKSIDIYAPSFGCLLESSDLPDLECPTDEEFEKIMVQIRQRLVHDLTMNPEWAKKKTAMIDLLIAKLGDEKLQKLREQLAQASGSRRKEIQKNITSVINSIWPRKSDTFLVETNILYSGSAIVDLIASLELVGTNIGTHSVSISCMAHIYNAARQFGLLDVAWPEMDKAIELQGSALFVDDIPTTRKAMVDRFLYTIGLSRRGNNVPSLTAKRFQIRSFDVSRTSTTIMHYFDGVDDISRLVYQLEDASTKHDRSSKSFRRTGPSKGAQKSPQKKSSQKSSTASTSAAVGESSQRSFRQTLEDLEKHVDAVLPVITFDYIALTRTCSNMLSALREELVSKLHIAYSHSIPEEDAARRGLGRIEVVVKMLHDNEIVEVAYEKVKREARHNRDEKTQRSLPKTAPVGLQLRHAANFIKTTLEHHA
ncbi:hypothetical protein GGR53DRAFT_461640 [Hypoxylon sp. FL1150]|nr:hypothetical protein GGR53DRAFT_461640 [Hypoxylon sp. FL1150]